MSHGEKTVLRLLFKTENESSPCVIQVQDQEELVSFPKVINTGTQPLWQVTLLTPIYYTP